MKTTLLITTFITLTLSPAWAQNVASPTTIEEFFEENSTLRISDASVQNYKEILNQTSLRVITRAEELAQTDKRPRKTILPRDVTQAADEIFRRTPITVPEIMEKIDQLSIIDLAELINQVNAYAKDLLAQNE